MHRRSSRKRLAKETAVNFTSESFFDRIARAVCDAQCLPRKELYESWEMARRVRRYHRGKRIIDMACGHGLLGYMLLLLDNTTPEVLAVDVRTPLSAMRLKPHLELKWPRLRGRVHFVEQPLESIEVQATDLVVSAHACGGLTDLVLDKAVSARADVAVLPCCHPPEPHRRGGLGRWLDADVAIDVMRAMRLREHGYEIKALTIPAAITPKNRLLIGSFVG